MSFRVASNYEAYNAARFTGNELQKLFVHDIACENIHKSSMYSLRLRDTPRNSIPILEDSRIYTQANFVS